MLGFVSQIYDFLPLQFYLQSWGTQIHWEEIFFHLHEGEPHTPLWALKGLDLLGFLADYGEGMSKVDMFFNYSELNPLLQNTLPQLLNEHILRSLFDLCEALATGSCREERQIPEHSQSTRSAVCRGVCNYGSGVFSENPVPALGNADVLITCILK